MANVNFLGLLTLTAGKLAGLSLASTVVGGLVASVGPLSRILRVCLLFPIWCHTALSLLCFVFLLDLPFTCS